MNERYLTVTRGPEKLSSYVHMRGLIAVKEFSLGSALLSDTVLPYQLLYLLNVTRQFVSSCSYTNYYIYLTIIIMDYFPIV